MRSVPLAEDLECCLLRGSTGWAGVGAALRRMICGSRSCAPPECGDVEGLMVGEGVSGRGGGRSMAS
eukprot:10663142-Heterocapsa_arctica.AAC.1